MADPLAYWRNSFETDRPARMVVFSRDPTQYDNTYPVSQLWLNELDQRSWQLMSRTAGLAVWEEIDQVDFANLGIQYAEEILIDGVYALVPYTCYFIKANVTLTLPTVCPLGAAIAVMGRTGSWVITQGANQQIEFLGMNTTLGVGGSMASTTSGDTVTLRCAQAGLIYQVADATGNLDII